MTNSEWLGGTLLANPSERVGSRPQAPPKDAWELFKGKRAQRADDPLADAHAALLRAIAELRPQASRCQYHYIKPCTR
jgi:hypothetical protein